MSKNINQSNSKIINPRQDISTTTDNNANSVSNTPVLEIKGIMKKYTRQQKEFNALNNINLTIDQGEFVTIIGKSGSGKTTLLNIIDGLVQPTEGTILLEGNNISSLDSSQQADLRSNKIGYILQGNSLLPNLNVYDNIQIPHQLGNGRKVEAQEIKNILNLLGIGYLINSYPKELSGGELKRVAIARALINNPVVILADEPTGDLDEENTTIIMEIFQHLLKTKATQAIIMVTHDLDTLKYSTSNYIMKTGKLTAYS